MTNSTYEHIYRGTTNHAEVGSAESHVHAVSRYVCKYRLALSLSSLVSEFFYRAHDPTTLNRQGNNVGSREYLSFTIYTILTPFVLPITISEYQSAIFTHSDKQENIAKRVTKEIEAKYFAPKG